MLGCRLWCVWRYIVAIIVSLQCSKIVGKYPAKACKAASHRMEKVKAVERFFSCDHCHARCSTFNQPFPLDLCICGARPPKYTRTGKMAVRVAIG